MDQLQRYSRQILFDGIGAEGQRSIRKSRVLLVGCGALGSILADTLVRAGVGQLHICDRDYIERDNLQRQVLFDEEDIKANLPKAQAAAVKLARINSDVQVTAHVVDVNSSNIGRLADGADLLLDGTDNFETRFLINDLAVQTERPWIYGAVVGATGLCMTILVPETPCLRCVFEQVPPPELSPTCDTAGVIAPAVHLVAGLQSTEALKILAGRSSEINRHLIQVDAWSGRFVQLNTESLRSKGDCPCCDQRKFSFLSGEKSSKSVSLCGRNAVQVIPRAGTNPMDFAAMAQKLEPVAQTPVIHNEHLLRVTLEGCEVTLFADARAIIKGTGDLDQARSLYAKYIGA